jgi:hypothetical protein
MRCVSILYTKIDEYELCLQWNKNFKTIIVVNMLTQLHDGGASNSAKMYLEAVGFDTLKFDTFGFTRILYIWHQINFKDCRRREQVLPRYAVGCMQRTNYRALHELM